MVYRVDTGSDYWARIHSAFPAQRGPLGEPSLADYEEIKHPRIVAVFAENFDQLHQFVVGRPDYREHWHLGTVVPLIVVQAQLRSDGTVELLRAIIESEWPDD